MKLITRLVIVLAVYAALCASSYAQVRTWNLRDGSDPIRAKFVKLEGESVYVQRLGEDELIEIRLDRLTDRDQQLATRMQAAAEGRSESERVREERREEERRSEIEVGLWSDKLKETCDYWEYDIPDLMEMIRDDILANADIEDEEVGSELTSLLMSRSWGGASAEKTDGELIRIYCSDANEQYYVTVRTESGESVSIPFVELSRDDLYSTVMIVNHLHFYLFGTFGKAADSFAFSNDDEFTLSVLTGMTTYIKEVYELEGRAEIDTTDPNNWEVVYPDEDTESWRTMFQYHVGQFKGITANAFRDLQRENPTATNEQLYEVLYRQMQSIDSIKIMRRSALSRLLR